MKGTPKLLVSPDQIVSNLRSHSPVRKLCVLRMFSVSPDGKVIAYAYSLRDSIWLYIRFREVDTGKEFPEVLKNVCHSDISWIRRSRHKNIRGIVYSVKLKRFLALPRLSHAFLYNSFPFLVLSRPFRSCRPQSLFS